MPKKGQGFPFIGALLKGFTQEEAEDLEALYWEDKEAYREHIDRLSDLGADRPDYEAVNGAVKQEMYEIGRDDRDFYDAGEMETRVLGRTYSAESTTDLETAAEVARDAFRKAKKETGWWGRSS